MKKKYKVEYESKSGDISGWSYYTFKRSAKSFAKKMKKQYSKVKLIDLRQKSRRSTTPP